MTVTDKRLAEYRRVILTLTEERDAALARAEAAEQRVTLLTDELNLSDRDLDRVAALEAEVANADAAIDTFMASRDAWVARVRAADDCTCGLNAARDAWEQAKGGSHDRR